MYPDILTTPGTLFLALLGGILPATFWLWFWLKEDRLHPEPRGLLIMSFLAGMLATALAFPIEKFIAGHPVGGTLMLLSLWSVVEETLKFAAIYLVALRTKYFDEPIDAVIYLVTIALGFAALENALFIWNPLGQGDALATITLGNFRFVGATLLHVAASGLIGVSLALTFYKRRWVRMVIALIALCGASILHTWFNFSIISSKGDFLYGVFVGLWIFIIGILLLCEKIKRMAPRSHVEHPHTGIIITIPPKTISP
ncbi:MAG TPA: PrsW family glutamic-type intramembrane protease [Candidatus Peribacteraceae bacterium]|nr:PrsW family glutamic-type intramembrane protease [Candidatus Peribacteraceae bacterium]